MFYLLFFVHVRGLGENGRDVILHGNDHGVVQPLVVPVFVVVVVEERW